MGEEMIEKKVSKLASIRLRCILLVAGCVILTASVCFATLVPKFTKEVSNETKSNMLQLCIAYGKLVENDGVTTEGTIDAEQVKNLLSDVKIRNMGTSYFYLVGPDGTMLYHPEETKIGQPVENAAVKEVVEEIKNGSIPKAKVVTYDYHGTQKYAAFYVNEDSKNIMVLTADESDIYKVINSLTSGSVGIEAVICMVLLLLAFMVSRTITKPIVKICELLKKASELDFTVDHDVQIMMKRKDEFGLIAFEYRKLEEALRKILGMLGSVSVNISKSSDDIIDAVHKVNEHSKNNSATSQQLASGMEETAATVDLIDSNITTIQNNTNEISERTILGTKLATEIKERADELEHTTKEAIEKADAMFTTVQEKSTQAIEQSKAVDKINVLSNTIMEIADETALLSLNASIEAARAGEMGKGFGVVANEIGKLASQSASTVAGISAIVNEVQLAVNNMSDCLEVTMEFIEQNVRKDYVYFKETSSRYNTDASTIQGSMDTIHEEIKQLSIITDQISSAVSGILSTINESAAGVTDIAAKTTDVVGLVSGTGDKIQENKKHSEDLQRIVERFKL